MQRDKNRIYIFEKMPVKQAVLRQVIPCVVSQIISLIYGLADTYFVGMLGDSRQNAAITIAASSFFTLTAVANLFGVGGASLIASLLGQKKNDEAKTVSSIVFYCALIIGILYSGMYYLLIDPVIRICGATDATYQLTRGYVLSTVVFGGPLSIMSLVMSNLLRAEGKASVASFGLSMGGILNILLDPVFVLPAFLNMGAVGAGIATGISNAFSFFYFLIYVLRKKEDTVIELLPESLKEIRTYIGRILSVGFPSAVQFLMTVVAIAAQSHFVAKYETEAVAALGIVKKVDQLPLYVALGTANGVLPLLAYNHAQGNEKRREAAFRFTCCIAVGFACFCLLLFNLFPRQITGFFINDLKTVDYAASFLRRMVVMMPFMAVNYTMIIQFQAMGYVKEALILSLMRKGMLDIPLYLIMDPLFGLDGCIWVPAMVDIISFVAALILYIRMEKTEKDRKAAEA